MRRIPVLGLLLASACGDAGWPDGMYLLVDGHEAQIEFDSVEVLFAKPHGDQLPLYTPSGYQPNPSDPQLLMKRVAVDASGTQAVPMGQQIDLYLPPEVTALHGVGEYAVVIASRGGEPVGIGEVFNFRDQISDITRFQIVLQPYPASQIERWGRSADGATPSDCLRWTRTSGEGTRSIAIVRENDNDCDAYPDTRIDCDARAYCDGNGGRGCLGDNVPCANSATCSLGRCVNEIGGERSERVCQPTTCLMDEACARCDETLPPEEYLRCAAHPDTHIEAQLSLRGNRALCQRALRILVPLADGQTCANPYLEWARADDSQWSPFTFKVEPIADVPGACAIVVDGPDDVAFDPHHLLISVDVIDPAMFLRSMFTIGIEIGTVTDQCVQPLYSIEIEPEAIVGSCLARI